MQAAQLQSMPTRHTWPVVTQGQARFVQTLDKTATLHLSISLPLRDENGLKGFIDNLYNPASPNYRQFLTVAQFRDMFGPTQSDFDNVVRWSRENGFVVTETAANRMLIQVNGRVSDIEKAFHVNLNVYHDAAENRDFYAPDREPMTDSPAALLHVSGLDNYSLAKPAVAHSDAAPQATGSGPGGQFIGSDFRAAYYGSGKLNGKNQSLGLLEYVGYNPTDITLYFNTVGQTLKTKVVPVSTDGTPATCTTCDDTEQSLDIEDGISMAPGMKQCVVYVGSTDTAMLNRMVSDNSCKQLSSSWEWRPADASTLDPIFMEMAAQGQNFFEASGDDGAYNSGTEYSWPADDQNITAVGGTDLVTNGPGGAWMSETAWVDSGGGISLNNIKIPTYQKNKIVVNKTNKASKTLRNVPDVAAEGNFDNYICYDGHCAGGWGGTSFATPRWGGFLALANQQATKGGGSPLGFINPAIYAIGEGSSYTSNFHDITVGGNGGYTAVAGYDLVTGWGSMIGPTLINTLTAK